MANTLGKVKIEFYRAGEENPAVTGTDCVLDVDGRFSQQRVYELIAEVAEKYTAAHTSLEWRKTVYSFKLRKEIKIFF